MKINIIRGILIILLIITFGVIFKFSSQTGTKSSGVSQKVTEVVTSNIRSIQEKNEPEKEKIITHIEHIIRKIAHFSIYTVVGILIMSLCETYKIKELDKFSISIITGILYATSDEIHQIFTPGRSSMFTDVLIDTMGVLLGILMVLLIIKIVEICKKRNLHTISR